MFKFKYAVLFVAVLSFSFLAMVLLNPKASVVCDDFQGGRLPPDATRGTRCDCAGWKIYLEHEAPADGRDFSLCVGLIENITTIK